MSEIMTAATEVATSSGKARRVNFPRKALNVLGIRPDGFDPIALLENQSTNRVPDLVPLRYTRMAASEFAFLRGSAAIMAYDLGLAPSTGIDAQLCGDAHILNFGIFFSTERRLTFDVNDFDETLPGPFEWDLKRMAASAAVSMAEMNFSEKDIMKVLLSSMASYRNGMKDFAQRGNLDVWYASLDLESNLGGIRQLFQDEHRSPVDDIIAKAKKSDSKQAFNKMIVIQNGRLQFRDDPPLIISVGDLPSSMPNSGNHLELLESAFAGYRASLLDDRSHLLETFERVDLARKVVGVGSVGTRCFVALFMGRSYDDPFILQIKEAMPSVLESHLGRSHYEQAGQRVVAGQRLMQTTPDMFLGYTRVAYSETESHDFYFRQYHDGKASVDVAALSDAGRAAAYVNICAWTLARAHARSGDRMAISSYLGGSNAFDKAVAEWAYTYVDRNREDFAKFNAAIASGRLPTMPTPDKK